jgi:predicted enzyme related to lactoylglutathione lyase
MTGDGDITGLAGVLVWTSMERFGAMRDFYVHTLGLTPRSDRDGFVNFGGPTRLTVAVHEGVSAPAADPLRIMVNLAVADIDATHARLSAAGVAFIRPPEPESWGGMVATFADPDGNTLQLLEIPS